MWAEPFLYATGKVVEKQKLTLVDEAEKRDYTNKIGKELLTKASSRISGLKADIE